MLNLNISILTTGVTPPSVHRCVRCKPAQNFGCEEELRTHTQKVHHRAETPEEQEGRKQNARWTELKPDYRITDKSLAGFAEEVILLHEDNIHYNIIVHKNHNVSKENDSIKKHNENHKEGKETLFGDILFKPTKISNTYAQVTNASLLQKRPSVTEGTNETVKDDTDQGENDLKTNSVSQGSSEKGWKTVINRGSGNRDKKENHNSPLKHKVTFAIPINNRFDNLAENTNAVDTEHKEDNTTHACQGCSFRFQTKSILEEHKRNAHGPKLTNNDDELDKDKVINSLKNQLNMEKKANRQTSHAYESLEKEYRACESIVTILQEENERYRINNKDLKEYIKLTESKTNINTENVDKENHQCKECGYPFKEKLQLDTHMEKHKSITKKVMTEQKCHLCSQRFGTLKGFEKHVTLDHVQYNCSECSFQAERKWFFQNTQIFHIKRKMIFQKIY